jgi:hypothetical protein
MAKDFRAQFERAKKAIRDLGIDAVKPAGGALFREAEEIMGDSKDNYVPVDFGTLRNSGFVDLPVIQGTRVTVRAGFGGPAAPYALAVHENPRSGKTGGVSPQGKKYQHFAAVGQWKYLEIPFRQALRGMDARLARRIRADVKELE